MLPQLTDAAAREIQGVGFGGFLICIMQMPAALLVRMLTASRAHGLLPAKKAA